MEYAADNLPEYLRDSYNQNINKILQRLEEFQAIKIKNEAELYFYEFCFCILTPQSSAKNAISVQKKLQQLNFFNLKFNPVETLAAKENYIRFHNQKAKRLLNVLEFLPDLLKILDEKTDAPTKRINIKNNFVGLGMKESSHFLRNVGYKSLAIIDRHILRHLQKCGVINEAIPPKSDKQYLQIEQKFLKFCDKINIPIDVMDFIFFAHSTGEVLK